MPNDKEIKALLQERAGYVARKLDARVAGIDASLAALGYTVLVKETATLQPPTERANIPAPNKRKK